jgi:hypothetical protein
MNLTSAIGPNVMASATAGAGVIRAFLLFEAIAFGLASLIHRGFLVQGYRDEAASTAEGIIGLVLVVGLLASLAIPGRSRLIGLLAQGFALLGTSVGLFFVISGIGPNTVPDIVFHIGIYLVLILGLVVAIRLPRENP